MFVWLGAGSTNKLRREAHCHVFVLKGAETREEMICRKQAASVAHSFRRGLGTTTAAPPAPNNPHQPTTHFKITLRRSAISLGDRKKGTLKALGLHRRMQTVFHPHTPDIAGKILAVKELLEVENVAEDDVRTKPEMRQERKGERGYRVVGEKRTVEW